jgi:hypothetical protein
VYEIARKHCGHQSEWRIGLALLLKKTGSQSPEKRFRQMIKELAEGNHLPDYFVQFDTKTDMVHFRNRGTMKAVPVDQDETEPWSGRLDASVMDDVRCAAPGWDPYYIEHSWRAWLGENEIVPKHPERHLVKFAKSWFEKRGSP